MQKIAFGPHATTSIVTPRMALGLAIQYVGTLPQKQQNLVVGVGLVGLGLYLLSKS